jgi:chromate transporter
MLAAGALIAFADSKRANPLGEFFVLFYSSSCWTLCTFSSHPTSSYRQILLTSFPCSIDINFPSPPGTYAAPSKGWDAKSDLTMRRIGIPLWVGFCIFLLYAVVLVVTILLVDVFKVENEYLKIFEVMFRIGSIIFGGGQVVLPMLQNEVVPFWMTKDNFFQGLGLAQSMPGPLFNFSAYLGAVYKGVPGALIAYIGLFGPGVILIFAIVPFWARLRHVNWFKVMLNGVNSTAIGLVGAACVILWEAAVGNSADAIVFCFSGVLAMVFNVPAPFCVIAGGVLGAILSNDVANLGQVPY